MNTRIEPVLLEEPSPQRVVHRASLTVFRTVRMALGTLDKVPGTLHQAVDDVRQAWRESARPNA